eukprot:NODE_10286_length_527_cov_5.076733_g9639_i0.p1 GENE.NODE_10286_length_527_cov_5.076733_g9639_i0~~NODE_10286_length_527_cov_5.076733_g9639_i0.p1  ORF type:complete len:155 (+),score=17.87 NODE_10286_length_527_cov_5.076733_g9639_i0:57-467(+)
MKRYSLLGNCITEAELLCKIATKYEATILIHGNSIREPLTNYQMLLIDRIRHIKGFTKQEFMIWELLSISKEVANQWLYTTTCEESNPYMIYNKMLERILRDRVPVDSIDLSTIPDDLHGRIKTMNANASRPLPEF